jgi:PAS domain S-box-containing protein
MSDVAKFRHSLRTPLNHIIGYSEMLIEDTACSDQREVQVVLKGVRAAALDLLQVIQRHSIDKQGFLPQSEYEALWHDSEPVLGWIRDQMHHLIEDLHFNGPDVLRIVSACEMLSELLKPSTVLPESSLDPTLSVTRLIGSARILAVDDDENNRDMLRRQLVRLGYEVTTASSGLQALELVNQESFDLILLDIVMPEIDGFGVLASLQTNPPLREIPVIVLSALDEMESVARCIAMGASDFIAKPFERMILHSRIEAVLRRRNAERERSQLADRLGQLLESTSEGIFGIDCDGFCTFINQAACKMLGYSRQQLLGRNIHETVHAHRKDGEPYPPEQCPMNLTARNGEANRVVDELFWPADGEPFPVEYASNPVYHDQELQGAVITFSDIRERKRAEESFRETAKLESLGVLAGGVAHDFNNLLTGILGNASLVLESPSISKADRECLGFVIEASQRAADLTRQLLAYAGKGKYEIRSIDLPAFVKEAAPLLQTMIPRTVRLNLCLDSSSLVLEGDPSQIQQVLMNLVINGGEAIAVPHSGTVTVSTFRETIAQSKAKKLGSDIIPGEFVVLQVNDTGAGMKPDVQARIFDPFYTTKFTGRGLGLAAVAGIVKGHRGAIEVHSEVGNGTEFRVYFPLSHSSPTPAIQVETLHRMASEELVLVVDDEEIILRTASMTLERKGYRVLMARGGEEAVRIFREQTSDISLILLDMMMPGMSGDQALLQLRELRPNIPIIVSSGYSESQVMKYFKSSDVSAFIQKPYNFKTLITKVSEVLSGVSVAEAGSQTDADS